MKVTRAIRTTLFVAALLVAGWTCAGASFTRSAMLDQMVRVHIASGLRDLAGAAAKLSACIGELQDKPGPESLAAAQQAWIDLHLLHKRWEMLYHGPVKDRTFWTAAFFKQPYPTAVDNVIRSAKPIDADFIEVLGSSAKGFYAMEYLLFNLQAGNAGKVGEPGGAPPRLSAAYVIDLASGQRRRQYLFALATDLERRLKDAAAAAVDSELQRRFTGGGQDSVNLLVNQLTDGIESGLAGQMRAYVDALKSKALRFEQIQGAASGTSLSGMLAQLEGLHVFYQGGKGLGIDDYIQQVNPELAAALEDQFQKTLTALRVIKRPFEESLLTHRTQIEDALEECKVLELMVKVDLVSALGVTIMFSANDGD